jgi:O-antigen ligase
MLILAALAWAAATAWWALEPRTALLTTGKLAVIASLGGVGMAAMARPGPMATPVRAMAVAMTVCLAVLLLERLTHKGVSQLFGDRPYEPGQKSPLNQAATVYTVWLWPLAVALARLHGRRLAVAFAVAAAAVIALTDSQSGRVALCVGLLVFALAGWRSRLAFAALRLGVTALVLATPLLVGALPAPQDSFQWRWLPNSAHHRLAIWSFAGERIAEHPWRGWGMEASRAIPGGDDEARVARQTGESHEIMRQPQQPLQPHSARVQVWLELGLPGALLVGALLLLLLRRIERTLVAPAMRAALAASFAAAFVVANLSFGLWQSWWQAHLWLLAVMLAGFGGVSPPAAAAASPPPGTADPDPAAATGDGRRPSAG